MKTKQINKTAFTSNSFIAIPDAFDGATEAMKHALKMEIRNLFSDNEILGEQVYTSDRLLIDFGTADFSETDLQTIKRDCELIIKIINNYPKEAKKVFEALKPESSPEKAAETFGIMEKIGFTELSFASNGGGLIGVILLVGGALLLAGCQSCTGHGRASRKPSNHPN